MKRRKKKLREKKREIIETNKQKRFRVSKRLTSEGKYM